jgi:hypothetical protein
MVDEAKLLMSIQIDRTSGGTLHYRSYPNDFTMDISGSKGPTPGAIEVSIYGTDVTFSELTTPGIIRISNQDDTNFITWGIADTDTDKFYPVGEILPSHFWQFQLSRYLGREYAASGTGTGTTGAANNTFRIIADTAACNVLVEAFEA